MTQTPCYELPDPEFHQHLCIDTADSLAHTAPFSLTSAGLDEAAILASCMPVVVVEATADRPAMLSAVLSLGSQQNLFYQNDRWLGHAVPLSLQCTPFNYVWQDNQVLTVLDTNSTRVGHTGEALFARDKSATPYLKQMQQRLTHLCEGQQQAQQFVGTLQSLYLLSALTLKIQYAEQPAQTVTGCATINEAQLARLPATQIEQLHQSGWLMVIHSMLVSLQQYNRLVQLSRRTEHPIDTVSLRVD